MKKKVLLYGLSTYKNKGVEAIVQSTINQIDRKKYKISAASFDYSYNKNFYQREISRYIKHYKKSNELSKEERKLEEKYKSMPFNYNNFELLYQNEVVDELAKSDICISIGGDNYCYGYNTWLYALDSKSHELGKKTVLWGASLFEEITDLELINNLNNFDVLVIRESLSYNAIKKYIPEDKLILAKDPAFSLSIKRKKLNIWYQKNKNYIVLNLSPLTIKKTVKANPRFKAILDLINYILEETDYSICLLPHVTTEDCNDLTVLRKIKRYYKTENRVFLEEENHNCNELKYIISKSKILVTSRTHASIAGYSTCIPTLVIGYSVKAKGIAKDLFNSIDDYVIDCNELTTDNLLQKFNFIDCNREKISELLKKQMPDIISETSNIFDMVLKKLEEQDKRICSREKCIGCGLCSAKCPQNAINMLEDSEGYSYSSIDTSRCINCNLCKKNCPLNNLPQKGTDYKREFYAAKNRNEVERKKSTSGGVFSVLAEKILSEQGIVYGCEMKNYQAQHIRITNYEELEKIRGSKYIQSDIKAIYKEIEEDLKINKKVLFSGTPCQIGTIKSLIKEDYENLITVSIICHGILNSRMLKEYISGLEKSDNKISELNFRVKDNGWTKSSICYKENGVRKVKKFTDDTLMYLYLKDKITRKSCYNCQFKGKNNVADIILGDYWGIELTNKKFYDENGVSAVIINSRKGKEIFDNVKNKLNITLGSYEDIVKYNPSLEKSINKPLDRVKLMHYIRKNIYNGLKELENDTKLSEKEYELNQIKNENENLKVENNELINELISIKSSKRWKLVNKTFNFFKKPLNIIKNIRGGK